MLNSVKLCKVLISLKCWLGGVGMLDMVSFWSWKDCRVWLLVGVVVM